MITLPAAHASVPDLPRAEQLSGSRLTEDSVERSEILRYRLAYAAKGIRTSPADTAKKKPHLKGWQKKATTSPQQITAESNRWPDAGILTPTGTEFGRWVLDVDSMEDLKHLEKQLGVSLRSISTEVRTQSGNAQIHFLAPEDGKELAGSVGKNVVGDFEKLDVRGEGNMVLLPPSAGYSFSNNIPMVQAPPELVEWTRSRRKAATKIPTEAGHRRGVAPIGEGDGPIPEGTRHYALASILGKAHDSTRSLENLTALAHEVNASRCVPPIGSPGNDPIEDVDHIAASIYSKPPCRPSSARKKDPRVEEALEACSRHWYTELLRGGGRSKKRDVFRACLWAAARKGQLRSVIVDGEEVEGIAFKDSTRQLAEVANTSAMSVSRNLKGIAADGALVKLDSPQKSSPTYVLLPRASLAGEAARTTVTVHNNPPPSEERGGVDWTVTPTRADKLVTPLYGWRSPVGNSGGGVEAAVEAFGPQTSEEFAERLGISRVRDLQRRQLDRLTEMGVLVRDGDRWGLPADHAAAVEKREHERYTTTHRVRRRKRTGEGRTVTWVEETITDASEAERAAARVAYHAAEREEFRKMRQARLDRVAAECSGGGVDLETGEIVAERRDVASIEATEAAGVIVDVSVEAHEPVKEYSAQDDNTQGEKLRAHKVVPEGGHYYQNTTEVLPENGGLSELAASLGRFLERSPRRRSETPSWLSVALWAEGYHPVRAGEIRVAAALGELWSHERGEAA